VGTPSTVLHSHFDGLREHSQSVSTAWNGRRGVGMFRGLGVGA
jgi:hypothetical protein